MSTMPPGARRPDTAALSAPVRFALGLGILLAFAGAGGALVSALRLPLPGAVVGMALLWGALGAGVVQLRWIESAADGLLGLLGLLFVPATAGVVDHLSAGAQWGAWLLVLTGGLLVGAAVAGGVASRLLRPEQA